MRAGDGTGQQGYDFPKHCWVTTSSGRWPGLLLEWVRDGDAPIRGRVIWVEGPVVHQAVMAAKQLEPFEPPPGVTG